MSRTLLAADVPAFLAKAVTSFTDSPEYRQLDESSQSVPGLVVGQLGKMLQRLQTEASERQPTIEVTTTLGEAYSALEVLSSAPAPAVQNLVVVEVLEHLHVSEDVRDSIVANLGERTQQLYRQWVSPRTESP